MGSVETEGPDIVDRHEHPMLEQLFFGLKGNECLVAADDLSLEFTEDMLLHIPLGSSHGVEVSKEKKLHYLWLDFFMNQDDMSYISEAHKTESHTGENDYTNSETPSQNEEEVLRLDTYVDDRENKNELKECVVQIPEKEMGVFSKPAWMGPPTFAGIGYTLWEIIKFNDGSGIPNVDTWQFLVCMVSIGFFVGFLMFIVDKPEPGSLKPASKAGRAMAIIGVLSFWAPFLGLILSLVALLLNYYSLGWPKTLSNLAYILSLIVSSTTLLMYV